jgi:hypothetical protein
MEDIPASPGRLESPAQSSDAPREQEGTCHDDARLLSQMAMGARGIQADHLDLDLPPKVLKQLERLKGDAPAFAEMGDGQYDPNVQSSSEFPTR